MARIVVDGHVRIVDAINTKEFSRSAIIRAVSAIESGRAVAKPGRPELFNEEDKNIIVGVIKIERVPAGFHTTCTNMPNATLVVAAAAGGYSLKSVVLWPCHKLPKEMRVQLSASIDIWNNNDGWMTESICQRYAEEVLLTGIIERRKILMRTNERCLLLLDSHSSRAQPDIWQKFADNNIDVVTFIPHSSHITQPLDRGVFAVFKKCINSLCSVPQDSSISLRREAISNVLPQALQTALLPATVVSSFKKSGVLSNEWHSVLSTLPNEPSVTLKKKTHRFDFFGKIITEQKFPEEWKKEKEMKEDMKRKEKKKENEEKILFAAEKPKKRKFRKSDILNDDVLDDESNHKNSRKIMKRELVDHIYY
ncbi:putative DDE superfamily endonuclease [Monocercomonoides exilis]|uniref:putative DDE superfamily endonuclease n=1 Tax=Monocercomonoides exilis TaxID=2049356 RepID=UPI003559460D|nr:putative DDE superfamily endonuclease [Monocercomonoides exilis]|eukprot:MONOS_1471.1-p1 / transcript=MONOS_1471.1 / gene=MONOS_1471 / organism=Monocercomonoides_exilis_PA203 / gene_product=unspecified product / transcript_product=unspecified product / location=Mono_scaffold00026:75664-77160(+) / protein_length=365 / sequence_SO=supercontig / SO=protein_coding / is_pseudo=false